MCFDTFYEILNLVDDMEATDMEDTISFMDFDWAASNVGPLSPPALDVMAFLENAPFRDDTGRRAGLDR